MNFEGRDENRFASVAKFSDFLYGFAILAQLSSSNFTTQNNNKMIKKYENLTGWTFSNYFSDFIILRCYSRIRWRCIDLSPLRIPLQIFENNLRKIATIYSIDSE